MAFNMIFDLKGIQWIEKNSRSTTKKSKDATINNKDNGHHCRTLKDSAYRRHRKQHTVCCMNEIGSNG